MIGIIDYGMGNLRSVQKGFERVNAEAALLPSPDQLDGITHLVLPGVGAFADGMKHLAERGWIEPIHAFVATGKPFLGICLGMQLLFESSTEDAPSDDQPVAGLGVLPGHIVQFDVNRGGQRIKVPHMGWNTIAWQGDFKLFDGLQPGAAVYFVHGYFAEAGAQNNGASNNNGMTTAVTEYPQGQPFTCAAHRGNVWATQFHPEKSQHVGLKMLANFAAL